MQSRGDSSTPQGGESGPIHSGRRHHRRMALQEIQVLHLRSGQSYQKIFKDFQGQGDHLDSRKPRRVPEKIHSSGDWQH